MKKKTSKAKKAKQPKKEHTGVVECSDCGEEIPPKRVEALPNVKLCIACQTKAEKTGKFQRHKIDVQPEVESWENVGIVQTLVRGSDV